MFRHREKRRTPALGVGVSTPYNTGVRKSARHETRIVKRPILAFAFSLSLLCKPHFHTLPIPRGSVPPRLPGRSETNPLRFPLRVSRISRHRGMFCRMFCQLFQHRRVAMGNRVRPVLPCPPMLLCRMAAVRVLSRLPKVLPSLQLPSLATPSWMRRERERILPTALMVASDS